MRIQTLSICSLAALAALAVAGCDKQTTPDADPSATATQPNQTAAGATDGTTGAAAADEPTSKPVEGDAKAMVKIPGTPHDQEHTKVNLTWGADGAAALYRSPGVVSKTTATPKWEKGAEIAYGKSWVLVSKPTVVKAKEGAKLFDAASYAPATGATAEAFRTLDVDAGSEVAIYKVAAEGFCYTGLGDDYYLSVCPQTDQYDGDKAAFSGPAKDAYQWWVLVEPTEGESGWLQVDDKVKVELTSTL